MALTVVGAALVDDLVAPGHLLAARRTAPPALAGRWELPGGKVEPGESLHDALHRELLEELGVLVRIGAALPGPDDGGWPLPGGELRVWWAQVTGGEPAPLEDHDDLRWLPLGSWLDVGWLPADVAVVRALQHHARSRRL
jgi:8-oxo-dGTP diphosphatase